MVDTVLSILANTHPNFELVVVDQSKDNETLEALKPFGADPRLRYVKIATVGKGNALNAGLTETKGSVIAITDDDCTVPPEWLEKFASIFATHPKVAVAFCCVGAGERHRTAGSIPDFGAGGIPTPAEQEGERRRRDMLRLDEAVDPAHSPS